MVLSLSRYFSLCSPTRQSIITRRAVLHPDAKKNHHVALDDVE